MNQRSLYTLFILISLIDLNESAVADEIAANIKKRRYLNTALDRDLFDHALSDLQASGHLNMIAEPHAGPTAPKPVYEVEYSAYGLLQSLSSGVSTAVSTAGLTRLEEVALYIDQVASEDAAGGKELLAESIRQGNSIAEAEYLVEKMRAETIGYPYDVLLQARETNRGRGKLYVVLLDDEVRKRRGVKTGNNPDLPALYVGMTSLSIAERFRNHKKNHKAGRGYVRDYGIRPLPELYKTYNPMPYKLAQKAEAALAEKLKIEGYTVLGGH